MLVCILTVQPFFAAPAFAEDHEIPAAPEETTPSKGGRSVDSKPKPTIGLNGKLLWEGRDLFIKTPLGKKVQLYTNVQSVREKLTDLANKPNQNIEIEGWNITGKPTALNVSQVSRSDGDYDGYYTIHFDPGALKGTAGTDLKKALSDLPGVKFKGHFADDDFVSIQSDLSLAQLRRSLAANPKISNKVDHLERDPILTASKD